MHRSSGTAAETLETEVDHAGAFREVAKAVYSAAATVAGTSLPGARGRRHHVHPTGVALPQGFKNVQLANEAIGYVQNISKVSASRPSHMFSEIARDHAGRIVPLNAHGEMSTFKPEARQHMSVMRAIRDEADRHARLQIDSEQAKGAHLTRYEQYVISTRHTIAVLLEKAKSMGPDQLVANCSEKAFLAFDLLANKEENPQLDVVKLANTAEVTAVAAITGEPSHLERGPDHALLVIGRDPNSDIADPGTWGDDTVICDPWAKRAYAVSAFKEEMELLASTTNGQTRCKPMISWYANTPYSSDPTVVYRERDGSGG